MLDVENDAMGLAGDKEGENAGPEKMGIGLHPMAVDLNAPLTGLIGRLDFDLPGLAVNVETELHGRDAFPLPSPTASRRAAIFQPPADTGRARALPLSVVLVASKNAAAATAGMGAVPFGDTAGA